MTDPKKPDDKALQQGGQPQPGQPAPGASVLPPGTSYPTPELDPHTGAPVDTRFQQGSAARQEETASKQSPKSGTQTEAQQREAQRRDDAQRKAKIEEDDDEDTKSKAAKGKEDPRSRR